MTQNMSTANPTDSTNSVVEIAAIKDLSLNSTTTPSDTDTTPTEEGAPLSKAALKKLEKQQEKERRKAEVAARLAAEKTARDNASPDYSVGMYGKLPLNMSSDRPNTSWARIADLTHAQIGQRIHLIGRVHTTRAVGSKMCFMAIRQRTHTVQAILTMNQETVSKQMLKFANSITAESLVRLEATLIQPEVPVESCTLNDVELSIVQLHVISEAARLPFSIEDASRAEEELLAVPTKVAEDGAVEVAAQSSGFSKVNLDTRLNNRVIDLRTTTNQAIFTIQAAVCKIFREFLQERQFTEIHTPKLIGAASEGGANVFKLQYFKEWAYLAQSPQLYKQMLICADFERVFEIAPVFRAENSQTHRHMTEFMGLDIEMAFNEHYHEVVDLFDELFVSIFKRLDAEYAKELEVIGKQYPFEKFQYLPKSLRLEFAEAIKMLREAGVQIGDYDDLSTESERVLGRLVKEKYKTDFFMLDKFPLAVRPFYTMPDPARPGYSNSYDFFIRGEEILSGAQRIHDAAMLEERAKSHGVELKTIQPYLDAFKYGAPPHAGGGIGLERVVMLYLNLGNIRKTSLFPRDPKRLEP